MMVRKVSLSILVAILMLALLVVMVAAQQPQIDPSQEEQPSIDPLVASLTQSVPVTLTVNVPGPDGVQTIEIPVIISLDIQIGISNELTASVQATTSVVLAAPSAEEEIAEEETPAPASSTAIPTVVVTAPTKTPATAETPVPTATPATAETPAPTATPAVTETISPTGTPTPAQVEVAASICPDSRAVIASPGVNQAVSGTIDILGTATHENFQYYKVEYAQGADIDPGEDFAYLADAKVAVMDGRLAVFNSEEYVNGAYTLKLTVVDRTGNFPPSCTVTMVVEN